MLPVNYAKKVIKAELEDLSIMQHMSMWYEVCIHHWYGLLDQDRYPHTVSL